MSELAAAATVLRSIGEVVSSGELARRATSIRADQLLGTGTGLHDPVTRTEVFTGMPGTEGAGAAAHLTARRADGRRVVWSVRECADLVAAHGVVGRPASG